MGNLLLNAWSTVGSVALAILILLVMITIHEFGHYLAGKILKFKIDEFSIGFGPALFKHRSKKTGELFAFRLIPLGGYCAFAGEDGLEEEKQASSEPPAGEQPEAEQTAQAQPAEDLAPPPEEGSVPQQGQPAEERDSPPKEAALPEGERAGLFTKMAPWKRIIVLVAGAFMNYVLAVFLIITCFFAYGQTITPEGLRMVEQAEAKLASY